MKMILLLSICAIASSLLLTVNAADRPKMEESGTLRHVVAFKFKSTATQEQIKQIETAFRDLKKKIPQINSYEWGLNNSPEKHNKGMTHGFILGFKSEADRDIYLNHADHKAFGALLGPILDDVFVIDFWSRS